MSNRLSWHYKQLQFISYQLHSYQFVQFAPHLYHLQRRLNISPDNHGTVKTETDALTCLTSIIN